MDWKGIKAEFTFSDCANVQVRPVPQQAKLFLF